MLFVVDARAGVDAGRRGGGRDPPPLAQAGARAREQDRRPGAGGARARVPPARARRPDPALGHARARHRRPARRDRRPQLEGSAVAAPELPDDAIRVAILGRPNVGKSSLFNALVGASARSSPRCPGTTRDAIDTVLERDGRTFVLVDTAGLRRKRRQRQGIEYYSELRALEAAERADVALVLIDSSRGDRRAATSPSPTSRARRSARRSSCSRSGTSTTVDDRGHPRPSCSGACASARRSSRSRRRPAAASTRLLDKVAELFEKHRRAIPTPELNRFLGELREARQPPSRGRPQPQSALRHAGRRRARRASASSSTTRASSRATTATGSRTSCASGSSSRACRSRSTSVDADVNIVVVGAGSWGTAFSRLLADRGHEVTLAARDAEQARAIARPAATRAT